ncbi:2-keto-4-pentenoate hydratase [Paenibacillus rigui]|uniref:2-keto-4-pentenoate hydratase n=1 Tax=Paenibacillus rigui TaxID=554312 RepID=A0A229UH29_9BACL|nr:fumarylacetoacetate hydrolase family protein [Paenibacillus rigui]OXM82692.1 2-keto-4-pentenoate hydratase [Paenibacillus rigui]
MDSKNIQALARLLWEAEQNHTGIQALTDANPGLTIHNAYQVQLLNIQRKVDLGQRITGKKIGLTSRAMQELLGVDQPDYGHLLDSMVVENGGTVQLNQVMQPKVEGEVAFVLKKDLTGPNVTIADVLQATEYVMAAIEIVDSRVQDWKIKLHDTIADNASCGLYVLGGTLVKPSEVDLRQIGMVLEKNGQVVNKGEGTAALGDPALCVAWLANKLHEYGIELKAGEVILSGALSAAVDASPGDSFSIRMDCLGSVTVNFDGEGF